MIVRQCDLAKISLLRQDAVAIATNPSGGSIRWPKMWSHAKDLAVRGGVCGTREGLYVRAAHRMQGTVPHQHYT